MIYSTVSLLMVLCFHPHGMHCESSCPTENGNFDDFSMVSSPHTRVIDGHLFAEKGQGLQVLCRYKSPLDFDCSINICIVYGNDNCDKVGNLTVRQSTNSVTGTLSIQVPESYKKPVLLATCFICKDRNDQKTCRRYDHQLYINLGRKPELRRNAAISVRNWEQLEITLHLKPTIIKNNVMASYSYLNNYTKLEPQRIKRRYTLTIEGKHYVPDTLYNISINVSNQFGSKLLTFHQLDSSNYVKPNNPNMTVELVDNNSFVLHLTSPSKMKRLLKYEYKCCSGLSSCTVRSLSTANRTFSVHVNDLEYFMWYNCSARVLPFDDHGETSSWTRVSTITNSSIPGQRPEVVGYQIGSCKQGKCVIVYWKPIDKHQENGDPYWVSVNCSLPGCPLQPNDRIILLPASGWQPFSVVASACNNHGCVPSDPMTIHATPSQEEREISDIVAVMNHTSGHVSISWRINGMPNSKPVTLFVCQADRKMLMDCLCQHTPRKIADVKTSRYILPKRKIFEGSMFGVQAAESAQIFWSNCNCIYHTNGVVLPPKKLVVEEKYETCTIKWQPPDCTSNAAYVTSYELHKCQQNGVCEEKVLVNNHVNRYTWNQLKGFVNITVWSVHGKLLSEPVSDVCRINSELAVWKVWVIVLSILAVFLICITMTLYRYCRRSRYFSIRQRLMIRIPNRILKKEDEDADGYTNIENREDSTDIIYFNLPSLNSNAFTNTSFQNGHVAIGTFSKSGQDLSFDDDEVEDEVVSEDDETEKMIQNGQNNYEAVTNLKANNEESISSYVVYGNKENGSSKLSKRISSNTETDKSVPEIEKSKMAPKKTEIKYDDGAIKKISEHIPNKEWICNSSLDQTVTEKSKTPPKKMQINRADGVIEKMSLDNSNEQWFQTPLNKPHIPGTSKNVTSDSQSVELDSGSSLQKRVVDKNVFFYDSGPAVDERRGNSYNSDEFDEDDMYDSDSE